MNKTVMPILLVSLLLLINGCGALSGQTGNGPTFENMAGLILPDPENAAAYEVPVTRAGTSALLYGWNNFIFPAIGSRKFNSLSSRYQQEVKILKAAADSGWLDSTMMYYQRKWIFLALSDDNNALLPGMRYWVWCNKKGTVIYFDYPVIQNILPASGAAGSELTITGANFGTSRGASTVKFAATEISYGDCFWSETQIRCRVPDSLSDGSYPVVVTVNSHSSNPANFYVGVPTIHVKPDGNDANDGLSWGAAKQNLQPAIAAAAPGGKILVADGFYRGAANKNLDFSGKDILLQSVGGAASCVIDCEGSGRAFNIHSGESADCTIQGFTITDARATEYGGGMYIESSNPTVRDCIFYRNLGLGNSSFGGQCGPAIFCYLSSARFVNCSMLENTSEYWYGGGIFCYDSCPVLINCQLSGNHGLLGGGVESYAESATTNPVLINCTLANNTANDGGAIQCWAVSAPATATLYNCVVWNNSVSGGVTAQYCDIQGGLSGTGNINLDPLFVNAGGSDYHLQPGSPCVDAGSNALLPGDITADRDGNPRVVDFKGHGAIVDMGAYERQDSPIHEWKLDEGTGDIIHDTGGSPVDGLRYNFTDGWITGPYNHALLFNSDLQQKVEMPHDNSFDFGTGDFSVELWLKTTKTCQDILGKFGAETTNNGWFIVMDPLNDGAGGGIQFYVGAGLGYGALSQTNVADNNWHHIVMVRTGATLRIYIDGNLDTEWTDPWCGQNLNCPDPMQIGIDDGDDPGLYLTGALDQVRIWYRVLTGAEINNLYQYNSLKAGL